ncbi:hypothetical protein L218DRAFT_942368 [Marasmius fiardii PR-910]|nr:hypothetical protein L218DRAFT_942368 [Marasmius fiardii PR-910]
MGPLTEYPGKRTSSLSLAVVGAESEGPAHIHGIASLKIGFRFEGETRRLFNIGYLILLWVLQNHHPVDLGFNLRKCAPISSYFDHSALKSHFHQALSKEISVARKNELRREASRRVPWAGLYSKLFHPRAYNCCTHGSNHLLPTLPESMEKVRPNADASEIRDPDG